MVQGSCIGGNQAGRSIVLGDRRSVYLPAATLAVPPQERFAPPASPSGPAVRRRGRPPRLLSGCGGQPEGPSRVAQLRSPIRESPSLSQLGDLLVGLRDLHPLADFEQIRKRLHDVNRRQRAVLLVDGSFDACWRKAEYRTEGPSLGCKHLPQLVVEMHVENTANHLREVVRASNLDGIRLGFSVHRGEMEQLAGGQRAFLGFFEREPSGGGC